MNNEEKLYIFTDGGARNNPGPAGIGVVIYNRNHKLLQKLHKYIGIATNNQAEYQAVIFALETVIEKYQTQNIEFYLDSQLVVEQLCGRYKVKNENIVPLFKKTKDLIQKIPKVTFEHITRDKNKIADALVNKAIKESK
jgi:ribonuclease HI